jgi:hypothetical protein
MATIHCHVRIEQALDALGIRQGSAPCLPGSTGEANLMANVGAGEGEVYRDKIGVTFNLRTLKAGSNITIATNGDVIDISAAGGGLGDFVGPAGATDEAVVLFDGTTGKLGKNSVVQVNDITDQHRIRIQEPSDPNAWKNAIQINDIPPNGLPGGQYIEVGDVTNPLLFRSSTDPWINNGFNYGRLLWENMQSQWDLQKEGTISTANGDGTPPLTLGTTGSNGATARHFVGDRDPLNHVTGSPGDFYNRVEGTSSQLYQHRGASSSTTGWVILGPDLSADDVSIQVIGTPDTDNVQDTINQFGMAGSSEAGVDYLSGASATTIDVAAGEGWLRATNSPTGELFAIEWSASAGITIPIGAVRYVGVEYNGGSPQISVRSSFDWNFHTEFPLGSVVNQGDFQLHIMQGVQWASSFGSRIFERFYETLPLSRAERLGGLVPSGSGRYLLMSAGEIYDGFTEYDIPSFDSSGSDRFDVYYRNGSGGWTGVVAQAQWDNANWDDGTGVLSTLTNNQWSMHWIYLEADGDIVLLYGQGEYASEAAASVVSPPSVIPSRISSHGRLLGRILYQEGASSAELITNVWDTVFAGVAGGGDVYGPVSATDEAVVLFDGTTGKLIKNSVVRIDDVTDEHQILIQEPSTPNGWKEALKIEDVPANGVAAGQYIILGNTDNPLMIRGGSDPIVNDGFDYSLLIWEGIKTDWNINRQGTISTTGTDSAAPIAFSTTGTNGATARHFVGTRDPTGNVTGNPGDVYTRVNGTLSLLYQHRGASSSTTGWVSVSGSGGGGPYIHGSKTDTQMRAISSPAVGDTVYNTTYARGFWWTGNSWQCPDTFEAINNSGTTLYLGDPVVGSSVVISGVTTSSTTNHPNILGVAIEQVSQGSYCAVARKGIWGVWVYGTTSIGDAIVNLGAGLAQSAGAQPNVAAGIFAIAAQSRVGSTTSSVINCHIGTAASPS